MEERKIKTYLKKNNLLLLGRILWLYTKYQIISKLIIFLVVFPIFTGISNYLIHSSGRTNLSSGDIFPFLLSFQGISVLSLALVLIIIIIAIDINAFVVMSALIKEGYLNLKIKDILLIGLRSIRNFFTPAGILLACYIAIMLPLAEIGIGIPAFQNFAIPNFIKSVILDNSFYSVVYSLFMLGLLIISFTYIFTLHFLILKENKIIEALKNSRKLMQKHWRAFLKDYFLSLIILISLCTLLLLVTLVGIWILSIIPPLSSIRKETWILFSLVTIWELITYFVFLSVPFLIGILTKLFYKYHQEDGGIIILSFTDKISHLSREEKYLKVKKKTKIIGLLLFISLLIINALLIFVYSTYFKEFTTSPNRIQIIAHRAGGDLGAENTVEGIKEAIKEKANWVEIDIQRTKDDKYIINHDANFARVAGVSKKPQEMTLKEIRKLRVTNLFDSSKKSQPVATFDDILDVSKGKIGVFAELKGATADQKMVDDVIKKVKKKGMTKQVVLLSLDYSLIQYISRNYPDMKTGYLYYFATGELKNLKGDYLIMEEREASPEKIDEIHAAHKKAIVWTVNTPESIESFSHSKVDGVITDHVKDVKTTFKKNMSQSQIDTLINNLFNNQF
ncbi:glycerophosphoryl diester phosphodiesterase membrane domain-containing protein [Streptococcus didelphis]|uniref:Glycerophosphoryl diester phosphodiesterase membrane domain-containing protein n=2 Tax=Streptococcus didelphis TaxID=102886 RepID=A0ABY9LKW0_9STRE|nr:glycerophosphodiester phosphodiesterase family protein [Streptococcus didelphis]WMB28736.1 glycerophosphoryl diester phosphodiesterase membrane domain-containing protein [Streptococcus didelphis]